MKALLYLLLAIYVAVFLIVLTICLDRAKEERLMYCYLEPSDVLLSVFLSAIWPITFSVGLFVEKKKGGEE